MFALAIEDSIARLRLSRPEARNAIPTEGWDEIASAALEAVTGGARALILSGVPGGVFCAGADISQFDRLLDHDKARTSFRLAMRRGIGAMRDLAVPTIALVEGDCYGAGVALAMACDIRIAGPAARFAITPAKLGISYPQEDVHRLVSLAGPGQAARLLLSASAVDGAEAARIGLVELFVEGGAEDAALALAASLAANDSDSLQALKRGIRLAEDGVAVDEEQDRRFDALLGSPAFAQRLDAYRRRTR